MNLSLFLRTISFLKPSQIANKILFHIKKKYISFQKVKYYYHPRQFQLIIKESHSSSLISQKEFTFINKTVSYPSKIQWNDPNQEKLWLYNLHYFDYLIPVCQNPNKTNFESSKKILEDWIDNNPLGKGNGWEPYPLSLRIVNWIFFYSAFSGFIRKDKNFEAKLLLSLYRQVYYLTHFIEYHILANHLLANLKALVFAGIFFGNKKWFNKYIPKLMEQVEEQILLDGGHFERSPMYQNIILTDLIDLINIINVCKDQNKKDLKVGLNELRDKIILPKIEAMHRWQKHVMQPDGEIPLLGDSAFKIALKSQEISEYYNNVIGIDKENENLQSLTILKESGYNIFRATDQYLIFDTGELGVSYQPGHAHCDILSFEYSYNKQRFFVDSGVGNYLESDLRLKARSINAHNTAVVNGLDQAQLWKAFRMAKRVTKVSSDAGKNWVEGRYENCIIKKKKYLHSRKIKFENEQFFVIDDEIESSNLSKLEFLFHTAPHAKLKVVKNQAMITIKDETIVLLWEPILHVQIKEWFYVPEFGKILDSKKLALSAVEMNKKKYSFIITPLKYLEIAQQYFEDSLN